MFPKPGPSGKADPYQAQAAGKSPCTQVPEGIGEIYFLKAAAVKKNPVFYVKKTAGNINAFQHGAVKKGPASQGD